MINAESFIFKTFHIFGFKILIFQGFFIKKSRKLSSINLYSLLLMHLTI